MLNYYGLITGIFVLVLTGIGHVIVIKGEYYFGIKIWPLFLLLGCISIIFSLLNENALISGLLGILGVTSFGVYWSCLNRRREYLKAGSLKKIIKIQSRVF